jgi:folate-binding protein YgfZ
VARIGSEIARTDREDLTIARETPLRSTHQQAEADFVEYGPADLPVPLVATFGEIEAEYAAIRKAVALIDLPHRGTLRVTGADRLPFLENMLTQQVGDLAPGEMRKSFWLTKTGRIAADLNVMQMEDAMLIDLDLHQAADTAESLSRYLFSEEVSISDVSEEQHRLALHGPRSAELLASVCDAEGPDSPLTRLGALQPGRAIVVHVGGEEVVVYRDDLTGEPGLHLIMDVRHTPAIYEQLLERGLGHDGGGLGLRTLGWFAFNIARIEAGTPMFNIDFGTDSLPHETGVLRDRVSFTKGCYLGQEVVARIESQGAPKQKLIGLRLQGEALPVTGAEVLAHEQPTETVIGAVTSATVSPMLSAAPIAFAMVRTSRATKGEQVRVRTESGLADATIHRLRFWPAEDEVS